MTKEEITKKRTDLWDRIIKLGKERDLLVIELKKLDNLIKI